MQIRLRLQPFLPVLVAWRRGLAARHWCSGAGALALGLLCAAGARADVWGYVDARGVGHFASQRLDDRYELFLRGEHPDPAGASRSAEAVLPTGGPVLAAQSPPLHPPASSEPASAQRSRPSRLMAYLEASPTYHSVQPLLREAAQIHGLDLQLLKALIAVESGFDAKAVSPKGAMGLMQLIVPTAQRYGLQSDRAGPVERKLLDPRMNIGAGTRYLRDLLALFPGRLDLALAAYNAGEGAVQRAGNQIPNYPETQNYVRTVMQLYQHLKPPPALAASVQPSAGPAVVPETLRTPPPLVGGAVGRGNMLPPRQSALPPPGPFAGTPLH